jgi:hypothetical protein
MENYIHPKFANEKELRRKKRRENLPLFPKRKKLEGNISCLP